VASIANKLSLELQGLLSSPVADRCGLLAPLSASALALSLLRPLGCGSVSEYWWIGTETIAATLRFTVLAVERNPTLIVLLFSGFVGNSRILTFQQVQECFALQKGLVLTLTEVYLAFAEKERLRGASRRVLESCSPTLSFVKTTIPGLVDNDSKD